MKQFELPGIGTVNVYRRRNNRNIRLGFDIDGSVRVSLPPRASYHAGLAFARQKRAWILAHRPAPATAFSNGQIVGKNYQLEFQPSPNRQKTIARISTGRQKITIIFPDSLAINSEKVQAAAERGVIKALKLEAERLLPARLEELAKFHEYNYKSVKIKRLKRRWGSCDLAGNITLNLYLAQLAPEQIDYVLIHELTHTRHPHHQAGFWQAMEKALPEAKRLRRDVRALQPTIT